MFMEGVSSIEFKFKLRLFLVDSVIRKFLRCKRNKTHPPCSKVFSFHCTNYQFL